MRPHSGPWDVLHCIHCVRTVDLWYETPTIIDTIEEIVPLKITCHVEESDYSVVKDIAVWGLVAVFLVSVVLIVGHFYK